MDNKNFIGRILSGGRLFFAVLILFIVMTFVFGEFYLALGEVALLAVLFIYDLLYTKKRRKEITNYMEKLSFYIGNAGRGTLDNFPLPLTVLNLTGSIVWHNQHFTEIVGANVFEQKIQEAVPGVQLLKILENKDDIRFDIRIGERFYLVVGNMVEPDASRRDDDYTIMLYWIDKTNEHALANTLDASAVASLLLYVDNYDDLIKQAPENEQASLSAEIEQLVSNWASSAGGILVKYEKDKYYILMENANLQKVIDDKFDILDKAHKIGTGSQIPTTFSIGVGKGDTLIRSDEYCRAALDMALGRGGDQAVVKNDENFEFFGGHTESYEKSNRVKPRVVAFALRELIDKSENVMVMGHQTPDTDAIGAAVGIANAVLSRGRRPYIIAENICGASESVVASFAEVEKYQDVFISADEAKNLISPNTLLVIVDTHSPSYTMVPELLEKDCDKVLIDHHRRGAENIDNTVLTYHEPYASSTCEIVTEILQYLDENLTLTAVEAQALYAGICLDTKNFTIKTGIRTFEAASFLRRCGVDTIAVKKYFQNDIGAYVKRAKIVSKADIYKDIFAISSWDEDEGAAAGILASQAADELLNVAGVSASFVLCRNGGQIMVSGRSLGGYNVQVIMEQLGGGGHFTVAGAQLTGMKMVEAVRRVKAVIDQNAN